MQKNFEEFKEQLDITGRFLLFIRAKNRKDTKKHSVRSSVRKNANEIVLSRSENLKGYVGRRPVLQ